MKAATRPGLVRSRVETISPIDQRRLEKQRSREQDKFMGGVYQCVKTHRNSEAIAQLLTRYDESTPLVDLETVFERVGEWGPSRTLLCLGRLIIYCLDDEKRFGRALVYIEKCQNISSQFALADLSKTLFYVRFAMETGKLEVAKNMLIDAEERYGTLVSQKQCQEFLQQALKNDIDIIL